MKLNLNSVSKKYKTDVIKNVSYTFESGKMYVIKGVSGCGKTTLLNIIGGIDTEFSGTVDIDGKTGTEILRKEVGYVFQRSMLISDLSVIDNLLLINGDRKTTESMLDRLGVLGLKDKMPAQLSGGERQRVAIARALICGCSILLADEPTSSLDSDNSKSVAHILSALRYVGKTVIVATHGNCFDDLADQIIHLDYGSVSDVEEHEHIAVETSPEEDVSVKKSPLLRLVLERVRRSGKKLISLPAVLLALLILCISTLSHSTPGILKGYLSKYYPPDVFNFQAEKVDALLKRTDKPLKVYYPYAIEGDGFGVMYYADKSDSVLLSPGMIKYGTFPDNENDVIVSYEFARQRCGDNFRVGDIIGKTVNIDGRDYTVSACLQNLKEDQKTGLFTTVSKVFDSDIFYRRSYGALVFIDYDTISQIGTLREDVKYVRISYKGLMSDKEFTDMLRNEFSMRPTVNTIEDELEDKKMSVNMITAFLYLILVICFIVACIFIRSRVDIDLFYRRVEIGYLQIFKIPKKRINKMLNLEYMVRLFVSVGLSLIVYIPAAIILSLVLGHVIIFDFLQIAVIFAVLLMIYEISLSLSFKKFGRRSIADLIYNR